MVDLPKGPFKVIYPDPPWSYTDKAKAGNRGAESHYNCMSLDDLKRLPVPFILEPDSACFMWVTCPMLPEGISLLKAWGFQYKTVAFTWIKKNKKSNTNFFGMGNWTRANSELCLLGVQGKPKRISASVSQIIESPIEDHSKKPDEVRKRIVELMGDVPRLEMFARQRAEGWESWGNELD